MCTVSESETSWSLRKLETISGTFVHRNFEIVRLLGSGAFGHVYEVVSRKHPKRVYAVKYVERVDYRNEQHFLNRLRHEHVIRLVESVEDTYTNEADVDVDIGFLFLDKCRTDLHHRMIELDTVAGPSRRRMTQLCRTLMQQIATGVAYLHDNHVIHRDLKPENILIAGENCVKLADFGLAVDARRCSSFDVVTLWYRAPEIIDRRPYDYAVDCWSVGCIFGEMLMGVPLMPGTNTVNQRTLIIHRCSNQMIEPDRPLRRLYLRTKRLFGYPCYVRKNVVRRVFEKYENYKMADLIDGLLEIETDSRYKMSEVVTHPFFTTWIDLRYF